MQSLDVELNVFNVHIFIATRLISTESEFDVISSWLGELLTEPGAPVTASLKTSHTALAIPQLISSSVGVTAFIFTAVVTVGGLGRTASTGTMVLVMCGCK